MNLSRSIIQMALVLALMNALQAQDSLSYSTLSVRTGLTRIANKDEFQSPYTYRGTNLPLNITFTRHTTKGFHQLDLNYAGGQIRSVASPEANNRLFLFSYDYLLDLRIKKLNKKLVPSLGFGLYSLVSSTNYLPKIEAPVTYLSASAHLLLSGNVRYRLNQKNNLRLQLGLSPFGFFYRPDFEINGNALAKTAFIGKGSLVSAKLEYDHRLTSKLYFTAACNYSYLTFEEPRPLIILQNSLLVGIKMRL